MTEREKYLGACFTALLDLMDAIEALPPYKKGVGFPNIVEEDEGTLNKAYWGAMHTLANTTPKEGAE